MGVKIWQNCNIQRAKKETTMQYPERVKQTMIQKMVGPGRISASSLSRLEGIPQPTLSKWLREAGTLDSMKKTKHSNGPHHPKNWSLDEKLRVMVEIAQLPEDQVGSYLRERGLYESQVNQWRQSAEEALSSSAIRKQRSKKSHDAKKIKQLEKELKRKDKALAETAALLVLKKKAQAIWGDEDDDTMPRNDK